MGLVDPSTVQLVTIPFSHYNERARWALQHHGITAHERRYLPLLHIRGVQQVTTAEQREGDATGSPYATPVLACDDGEVLSSSTAIVRWADARFGNEQTTLYPPEHRKQIEEIEQHAHDVLGPATRLLVYWFLFRDTTAFTEISARNVGRWQNTLFSAMRPLAKRALAKRLNINDAGQREARGILDAELASLSAQLGHRDYLVGNTFTAADLMVACMLAPAVLPLPSYGAYLPTVSDPEYVEINARAKTTKIGQHVIRMFEEHRPHDPAWTVE